MTCESSSPISFSVHSEVGRCCRKMTRSCHVDIVSCERPRGGGRASTCHLELHLLELGGPPHEERGAHIHVEHSEALADLVRLSGGGRLISPRRAIAEEGARRLVLRAAVLGEVRVPHAEDEVDRQLAHQQAVHPAERELARMGEG